MADEYVMKNPLPLSEGAYIIGKGPSLDTLSSQDFLYPTWPILAINEAVHAIEKLNLPNPTWCIQQDGRLGNTCRPARSGWLCSIHAWEAAGAEGVPGAVKYVPEHYPQCLYKTITGRLAIEILHEAGIGKAIMLAFDGRFGTDMRYASSIAYDPSRYGEKQDRFLTWATNIQKNADRYGMKLEWVPPPGKQLVMLKRREDQTTARQVRAVVKTYRAAVDKSCQLSLIGSLPGSTVSLRELPSLSLAGLFQPGRFTRGTMVVHVPLASIAIRAFAIPEGKSVETGILYAGPPVSAGVAGVMIWRAGTVTEPFVYYRDNDKTVSETALLEMSLPGRIRPLDGLLRIGTWPCAKDVDIIQCSSSRRPWDDDIALMKLEEY